MTSVRQVKLFENSHEEKNKKKSGQAKVDCLFSISTGAWF